MFIDLRSDTVTKPSKEMLEYMFEAEVGDDVFNEDTSINELEKYAANIFNMESALFCPSGTMANQIAIRTHTQPGEELICDKSAHIYNYETGGIASNSGVQAKLLEGNRGILNAKQVEASINPNHDWLAKTSLVSIENTVNKAGGSIYPMKNIKEISELCKSKSLKFHIDGARIFNALVESGDKATDIGKACDSISVCLSKGLGAPVGSLLIGTKTFILQARRHRKAFGGGMRQAGYLAAAGKFALLNNIDRLKEDHQKAKALEACLSECTYVKSIEPVETNIVIINLADTVSPDLLIKQLEDKNVKVVGFGGQQIRMVTHLDFTNDMLEKTITVLKGLKL